MSHHRGILFLVPTPIGNLEDMTYRAVRTLQEVDLIAAEDTRHSGLLLQHFSITTPLISYHEHNKTVQGEVLLGELERGRSIALISDAGMPAISDPGEDLVAQAVERGISIVPLPGANAALTALIASGRNTKEFHFIGFLPKRKANALEVLQRVQSYEGTLLFYEAPHRLEQTLEVLYESLGNRPVTLARELTKKFETFTVTDLASLYHKEVDLVLKGEFVLLVGGAESVDGHHTLEVDERTPLEAALALIQSGVSKKEAARTIAKERGLSRRDVYNEIELYLQEERDE